MSAEEKQADAMANHMVGERTRRLRDAYLTLSIPDRAEEHEVWHDTYLVASVMDVLHPIATPAEESEARA